MVARPSGHAPRRAVGATGWSGTRRTTPGASRSRSCPPAFRAGLRRPLPRVQLQLHVPRRGRPPRAALRAGHPHRRQPGGDADAWDWWQRNRLDAESQVAHTESLVKGLAYVLVWPDAVRARGHDRVGAPGHRRDRARQELEAPGRAQALARRRRPLPRRAVPAGRHLQVPAVAARAPSSRPSGPGRAAAGRPGRAVAGAEPAGRGAGHPLPQQARLTGVGESEIAMVMSIQDAIKQARERHAGRALRRLPPAGHAQLRARGRPGDRRRRSSRSTLALDRLRIVPPHAPGEPDPRLGEFSRPTSRATSGSRDGRPGDRDRKPRSRPTTSSARRARSRPARP